MAQKTTLTPKHYQAAVLVAEDKLSDEQIAAEVGIGRTTLHRWKDDETFWERVTTLREQMMRRIHSHGIARPERRMEILDDLFDRHMQVITERAAEGVDHYGKPVAGGSTGMIVRQATPTKSGVMYEYADDTAVSKEVREVLKQAAQEEMGWRQRLEVTGKDGAPLIPADTVFRFEVVLPDADHD